jgi:hypothetical protein
MLIAVVVVASVVAIVVIVVIVVIVAVVGSLLLQGHILIVVILTANSLRTSVAAMDAITGAHKKNADSDKKSYAHNDSEDNVDGCPSFPGIPAPLHVPVIVSNAFMLGVLSLERE